MPRRWHICTRHVVRLGELLRVAQTIEVKSIQKKMGTRAISWVLAALEEKKQICRLNEVLYILGRGSFVDRSSRSTLAPVQHRRPSCNRGPAIRGTGFYFLELCAIEDASPCVRGFANVEGSSRFIRERWDRVSGTRAEACES